MNETPPNPLAETRLRENVFVWTLAGDGIATSYGANCTAILGETAALLVDPFIAPVFARLVEERLGEISPVPIRHVLLTHHRLIPCRGAWDSGAAIFNLSRRPSGRMSKVEGRKFKIKEFAIPTFDL